MLDMRFWLVMLACLLLRPTEQKKSMMSTRQEKVAATECVHDVSAVVLHLVSSGTRMHAYCIRYGSALHLYTSGVWDQFCGDQSLLPKMNFSLSFLHKDRLLKQLPGSMPSGQWLCHPGQLLT